MGGEGPYVLFSSSRSTSWADHTGLAQLSDEELEAAYSRAGDFLKERKKELTDEHGWSAQPEDDTLFLVVTTCTRYQRSRDVQLRLPSKFASFLDHANNDMWIGMFQDDFLFEAGQKIGTLHIDGPTPLSDIFYLLQALCPGMVLIVCINEIDEDGEVEKTTRALPSKEWVKDHDTMLQHVLGSEQRYESLLAAATDRSKSFKDDTRYENDRSDDDYPYDDYPDNHYSDDDNSDDLHYTNRWGVREPLDYTACGLACGYCGQCDY